MGKYGNAAVVAATNNNRILSPSQAWISAINSFTTSQTSRNKTCPKYAYLGLCETGLVMGIPSGNYGVPANNPNKIYAVNAVSLLKNTPNINVNTRGLKSTLWASVGGEKHQNGQMDVVLSLWNAGLII